jgi:acetyl-CoA acetyltransferase
VKAAITGIGQSQIGRRLNRDPMALTMDACLAAISDAGLVPKEIDGVVAFPGNIAGPPGYVGPQIPEVHDALRLGLKWSGSGMESTGQLGTLFNACWAIEAGVCNHVLCYCTVWESTAQRQKGRGGVRPLGSERASGTMQWLLPFRAVSPVSWAALSAQRHFDVYGTTREQLAEVALNARRNAAKNPDAVYREALSREEYLASRMISTPLCLYDCDVPCDGAVAVIISRRDAAARLKRNPLEVESIGCAHLGRPSWFEWEDLTTMAMRDAAEMLWQRSRFTAQNIDFAQLYDGFSILTLYWLEALGFCKKGESGAFIQDGRIALNGPLPINTGGGQLSAGRLNGWGLLYEACVQLWTRGGERQVEKRCQVGLVASGGGPYAGCMILSAF